MKNILFLIISLLFISCSGNVKVEELRISGAPTILITDINKQNVNHPNIDVVHLKSNPFKEIGLILKVIDTGDRYIINDRMKGNTVFIYDLLGNYINHINRVGQGPGEYRNIENIFFKEITNELILYPMDGNKKIIFDTDGNYIREKHNEHALRYADLIYFGHDEFIANHSRIDRGYNFVLMENEELKKTFVPFDEDLDNIPMGEMNFMASENGSKVLFSSGIRDTLFLFDYEKKSIDVKYVFDFNNRKIDLQNFQFGKVVDGEKKKYMGLFNIFQNDRILTFTTFTQNNMAVFFYDKLEHKLYSGERVFQEIVNNGQVKYIVGTTKDGRFIGTIEPDDAKPLDFHQNNQLQKSYDAFKITDPDDKVLLIFDFIPK